MLQTIIIDDEDFGRENLSLILKEYCSDKVKVVKEFSNTYDARLFLDDNKVDLIFSDIEMPQENGIKFLESIRSRNIPLIFVSAHSKYALNAIKASALDYILKPIDIGEVKKAVQAVFEKRVGSNESLQEQINASINSLMDSMYTTKKIEKICLPHSKGFKIANCSDIMYFEGDNNYTYIYFSNGEKILVSKTLKDFETMLQDSFFFRIHKSVMVNLNYIQDVIMDDGGYVTIKGNIKLQVSRRRLSELVEVIKEFSKKG